MKYTKACLAILCLLTTAWSANADTLITANAAPNSGPFTSGDRTYSPGDNGDLGYLFQANANLEVTSLGQYIPAGDAGLTTTDHVFLYQVTGGFTAPDPRLFVPTSETQIASVRLPAGTQAGSTGFGYVALGTPVQLVSGDMYVIDYDGSNTDAFLDSQSNSSSILSQEFSPSITLLAGALSDGKDATDFPD